MRSPAALVRAKAREWARRRQGSDSDPLTLQARRLYILPTPQGVAFSAMLFAMLLGSMNYNNSLGLALTFFLAGLGLVAMHHCHRNVLGLTVRFAGAEPVFAGLPAGFQLQLHSNAARPRFGLQLGREGVLTESIDLEPGASSKVTINVPTTRRGTLHLERFSVNSTYPFGLFRAWSWVHMDLSAVVFPRPADGRIAPPPQHTDTGGAQDDSEGDADFAGLRNFRAGDSPRHIAWKAFAREQELLVKQYAGTDVTTHLFDFDSLPTLSTEQRLEQLCRWVVDAQDKGHAYGLSLPQELVAANVGKPHERRCLTALALF